MSWSDELILPAESVLDPILILYFDNNINSTIAEAYLYFFADGKSLVVTNQDQASGTGNSNFYSK